VKERTFEDLEKWREIMKPHGLKGTFPIGNRVQVGGRMPIKN